jgi:hypothetical protein
MPTLLPSHARRCNPCFDGRALAQAGDKGKSDGRKPSDHDPLTETYLLQGQGDPSTAKMIGIIAHVLWAVKGAPSAFLTLPRVRQGGR